MISTQITVHGLFSRVIVPQRIIGPRTIVLKIIDPGQFPPGQLLQKKIEFRMICRLHNCCSGNWPRGKLPAPHLPPPSPGDHGETIRYIENHVETIKEMET